MALPVRLSKILLTLKTTLFLVYVDGDVSVVLSVSGAHASLSSCDLSLGHAAAMLRVCPVSVVKENPIKILKSCTSFLLRALFGAGRLCT